MLITPFHASPPSGAAPLRRLLLLSYHFPPGQAVGALRWQKMAGIAAERGWQIDVITLDPSSLASSDPQSLRELPQGLRVFGVPRSTLFRERLEALAWQVYRRLRPDRTPAPSRSSSSAAAPPRAAAHAAPAIPTWRLGSISDWKRAYYANLENARDARWASDAAALARRLTATERYDLLVTCGPPHMIHWATSRVAAAARIPFVMDLRDPWSLVERLADGFASPHWFWLARRFEPEAVGAASLVVMNTEPARQAMAALYPGSAERIITVMNGFDEDGRARPQPQTSQFRMVFAGSVYLDRDPRLILRAVARLVAELKLEPRDFRIEFIGNVGSLDPEDPASIGGLARAEGVAEFVGAGGFRPRSELAALLADATMLISLYQDSRMAIPSKIFDYMQYDAWLLAFAEAGSATAEVLRGTDADIVDPQDREALFQVLARRYGQFRNGQRPVRMSRDARLSRRGQANRLFDRLESLAPLPRPTPSPERGR